MSDDCKTLRVSNAARTSSKVFLDDWLTGSRIALPLERSCCSNPRGNLQVVLSGLRGWQAIGRSALMRIDILTLFPEICRAPLNESMMKRAQTTGALDLRIHNLRDWTTDKHHVVDDAPFGGGQGMVMKPEPIFAAVEELLERKGEAVHGRTSMTAEGDSDVAGGTMFRSGSGDRNFPGKRISSSSADTTKGSIIA